MKKHIIGLAVFSFIVSVAAVVYAVFNVPEMPVISEVTTISVPHYVQSKKTHCKIKRTARPDSIEIRQAVFNAGTKSLDLELATWENDSWTALHFFSKDKQGIHYVQTTPVPNKLSRNGILNFQTSSYTWLNNRQSYENLYVIAEPSLNTLNYSENFQPEFDAAKATAITVYYGE